jgi:NADPH:quinone reductase-like Zn-dependent oxidoreductase
VLINGASGGVGTFAVQIAKSFGADVASLGRSQTATFFIAKITKDDLDVLRGLLEAGKGRSVIDRHYELSETADALRYLGERHARSKAVITV